MERDGFRKDYEVSNHFEIVHAGKRDAIKLLSFLDC
jgi:hypothetical protein